MFPDALAFTRAAVPFLKALPKYLRDVPGHPGLKHYGTGESGHWAVQINQQVAGALACLAEDPAMLAEAGSPCGADELRSLALAMTRYSLRTHCTGDLSCTDGRQWGRHWISVLGYERMTPGLELLRRHFTDDDEARLRAMVSLECEFRLREYELVAAPQASTGRNKPESNIWNGAFLLRAAADARLSGAGRREDWRERGTAFLLNGLSYSEDADDDTPVLGKPLRQWHVGANFFPDGALDHHGYLNVGYAYVCLSNLALLHFSLKRLGLPPPDGFSLNLSRTWQWCKRCTFPDGRLLRIGGDSRARYTYCQAFALQGWHLAWDLWRDEDAARFAHGYLGLVAREQAENPDGTFFGRRLAPMRAESPWFETRIECDPFTVLATSALWARAHEAPDAPSASGGNQVSAQDASAGNGGAVRVSGRSGEGPATEAQSLWLGAFHGAALLRGGGVVRSVVARACAAATRENSLPIHEVAPAALCLPAGRSDMAEWLGNLFAFIGLRGPAHSGAAGVEETPGGFRWRWEGDILETRPLGEGEATYPVLHRVCTAEALPDGRTMRLSDRVACIKETTLPAGYRALNLQIPDDVYNGRSRRYAAPGGWRAECGPFPAETEILETGGSELEIDGALRVRSLSGKSLRVLRPARQGALLCNGLTSLYVETVVTGCSLSSVHLMPGDVLVDEAYEVEAIAAPERA